jgi:hypothetical protein
MDGFDSVESVMTRKNGELKDFSIVDVRLGQRIGKVTKCGQRRHEISCLGGIPRISPGGILDSKSGKVDQKRYNTVAGFR